MCTIPLISKNRHIVLLSGLWYTIIMTGHSKIDLAQLASEIRSMNPRKKIYKVLAHELGRLDHWKDKSRGAHINKGKLPYNSQRK